MSITYLRIHPQKCNEALFAAITHLATPESSDSIEDFAFSDTLAIFEMSVSNLSEVGLMMWTLDNWKSVEWSVEWSDETSDSWLKFGRLLPAETDKFAIGMCHHNSCVLSLDLVDLSVCIGDKGVFFSP
jgi:hypothetical protein